MRAPFLFAARMVMCFCAVTASAQDKPEAKKAANERPIAQLEGNLRTHAKFLFKYYVDGFGDGQECALFGEEKLKDIKVGSRILVEGRLGTRHHAGGTAENPSPFPRTHYIYMDVESVRVLKAPE